MLRTLAASALLVAAGVTAARGQGTITDGSASFVRTAGSFDTHPEAHFTGVASTDPLFEFGWWFRVDFETSETALPAPTTQAYVGDTSTLTWSGIGPFNLLSFKETATVTDVGGVGADGGRVSLQLDVTNHDDASLTVHVFAMVDFDVNGASSDSATAVFAPRYIRVTDPSGQNAEAYLNQGDSYLVRPFGAADVAAVLSDASATTFDDTGLPFGPGDFTGGLEKSLVIPAGETRSVQLFLAVNASLPCEERGGNSLFCEDFELYPPWQWSAIEPALCEGSCGSFDGVCACDLLCRTFSDCCADVCLSCGFCPDL
jgi:hypothetical protein